MGSPKHISPARESFRKLIRAGREKTYNYYCAIGRNKKLKKKAKPRTARKQVERQLFANDLDENQQFIETEKFNESFFTASEASVDSMPFLSPIKDERKRVFMLSDFLKDREWTSRIISELGGVVAVNTRMEMQATHFICHLSKDTCSGMMVCALATGKWILHENYVTDSYKANVLLNERMYEWANYSKLHQLDTLCVEAANAGAHWRLKLEASPTALPFRGARVVFIMHNKYFKYYRLIFKALKAKVLIFDPRNPEGCQRATHCFVDMKTIADTRDLAFFAEYNIPVYPYQYILIYLLNRGNITDQHKYLLQDCKSFKKPSAMRRLNQTY